LSAIVVRQATGQQLEGRSLLAAGRQRGAPRLVNDGICRLKAASVG
jgi:hypothetical protein